MAWEQAGTDWTVHSQATSYVRPETLQLPSVKLTAKFVPPAHIVIMLPSCLYCRQQST